MKEEYRKGYIELWQTIEIRAARQKAVDRWCARLLKNRGRYDAVSGKSGVPWWFIGVIHGLEGAFNFSTHLHNGDPLSARTTHVPQNRPVEGEPPFTWEFSAIDALNYDKISEDKDWENIAEIAYAFERYNGFGYRKRGINSPYLWSFSNHYTQGKYASDGAYDPKLVSEQVGAMCILKQLKILE